MEAFIPSPENFHVPPQELRDIITAARSEVDRRVAGTKELLADDHFVDDDERTWALFDGLLNPVNLDDITIEDLACVLAWMASIALMELAKEKLGGLG